MNKPPYTCQGPLSPGHLDSLTEETFPYWRFCFSLNSKKKKKKNLLLFYLVDISGYSTLFPKEFAMVTSLLLVLEGTGKQFLETSVRFSSPSHPPATLTFSLEFLYHGL